LAALSLSNGTGAAADTGSRSKSASNCDGAPILECDNGAAPYSYAR